MIQSPQHPLYVLLFGATGTIGLTYSILRPPAVFKSLSGQLARVQKGNPFLLFGDGRPTACKSISERGLGTYLAACLTDPDRHHKIRPIGSPGPAISPRDRAVALFDF